MSDTPRITPGTRPQIGWINYGIARVIGAATGGAPPNIFLTLALHRTLFRKWLRFASGLMPGGKLPRDESELLILRVAHATGCDYEWHHHENIGLTAGLSAEEIERVREGPEAEGWSPRRRAMLRAADELLADNFISDSVWAELRAELSETRLIELCLLVGHYEMLAGTLNSLKVQPDAQTLSEGPGARLLQALQARRG